MKIETLEMGVIITNNDKQLRITQDIGNGQIAQITMFQAGGACGEQIIMPLNNEALEAIEAITAKLRLIRI